MTCKYCADGIPLEITYLDIGAFSESVEAYVDDYKCCIAVEKYDGDMSISAHFCPMCGRDLREERTYE